jgi:hypothetical protein
MRERSKLAGKTCNYRNKIRTMVAMHFTHVQSLVMCAILVIPPDVNGWSSTNSFVVTSRTRTTHHATNSHSLPDSNDVDDMLSSSNSRLDPCWGTMLDDDCSMGNIYAANFVASKWIKSMPCGEGIQVSVNEKANSCGVLSITYVVIRVIFRPLSS